MSLKLSKEKSFVVVVDIQDRLAQAMLPEVQKETQEAAFNLVKGAALLEVPVLYTEQYPKGLGSTTTELKAALDEAQAERVEKMEFDCCENTAFRSGVRTFERKQAVICGMEAHICVWQTVRGLRDLNYEVWVASDATASRDPRKKALGIDLAKAAGAHVTSSEAVLFDWLGGAQAEEFKAISKLVR